jgi:predicted O-methyltransferase YrrM
VNCTELYERALADPASDIAEYLPMFRETASRDDVTTVIELGVREGHSTAAFLAGLEGHGRLWSVDCEPMHDEELAAVPHWTFVLGDDNDPAVWAQLPERCDVAFVDTDHAFTHTVRELDLLAGRVRPGGLILLHDTENEHPEDHGVRIPPQPPFPVKQALQMVAQQRRWVATLDTQGWGMGCLQVPPSVVD